MRGIMGCGWFHHRFSDLVRLKLCFLVVTLYYRYRVSVHGRRFVSWTPGSGLSARVENYARPPSPKKHRKRIYWCDPILLVSIHSGRNEVGTDSPKFVQTCFPKKSSRVKGNKPWKRRTQHEFPQSREHPAKCYYFIIHNFIYEAPDVYSVLSTRLVGLLMIHIHSVPSKI